MYVSAFTEHHGVNKQKIKIIWGFLKLLVYFILNIINTYGNWPAYMNVGYFVNVIDISKFCSLLLVTREKSQIVTNNLLVLRAMQVLIGLRAGLN